MTPERLQELAIGYNLDGGGHEFDAAADAGYSVLKDVAVIEDPDLDYFPIERPAGYGGLSCPVLAFAPNPGLWGGHEFPDAFEDDDGNVLVKVAGGRFNGTDRECNCHGRMVTWSGAAGEPPTPLTTDEVGRFIREGVEVDGDPNEALMFEHTGDTSDRPYPGCVRCEGSGYVDSPGGDWAIFALREDEDEG